MAEADISLVPVDKVALEAYAKIIAYPRASQENVEARIRQLKELGVSGLDFRGPLRIDRSSVLGKGVVGIVVAAMINTQPVAVKIRRTDSRRNSMIHEATMMRAANRANVGPEYLGAMPDILVMELLEGLRLPVWLATIVGKGQRRRVRSMLLNVLEQAVRLDAHGIDHGELSRAHKNVLVSREDQPWIVDFESASQMRRVNNFTSLVQYFFLGDSFARKILRVLGPVDRHLLVDYLRMYKSGRTSDGFSAVQKLLKL